MDLSSKCMGKALREQAESVSAAAGSCRNLSSLLDLAQQLQQQLLGGSVLPTVPRVQVDDGSLKVGHHLVERPQLDQEQEVEVLQTPRALAFGLARVEALSELLEVGPPDGTSPAL